MTITVLPEDLIKRCVWDHYVYYVLGSDKEVEKILKVVAVSPCLSLITIFENRHFAFAA
jgi:hypothetical protein